MHGEVEGALPRRGLSCCQHNGQELGFGQRVGSKFHEPLARSLILRPFLDGTRIVCHGRQLTWGWSAYQSATGRSWLSQPLTEISDRLTQPFGELHLGF